MELTTPMNSILVALNDSVSSRAMMSYLSTMGLKRENLYIVLIHLFRQPAASKGLMGAKFIAERTKRAENLLKQAKESLIENGFSSNRIEVKLVHDEYSTIGDGIIDQYKKGNYDMVIIGRKKMSKAEEFVKGDISIKLIRSLESSAVLVVTSD